MWSLFSFNLNTLHRLNSIRYKKYVILFRSNAQIKKVDTVHAQDYGNMSANQLTSKINDNKKRDRKIAAELQYVL